MASGMGMASAQTVASAPINNARDVCRGHLNTARGVVNTLRGTLQSLAPGHMETSPEACPAPIENTLSSELAELSAVLAEVEDLSFKLSQSVGGSS